MIWKLPSRRAVLSTVCLAPWAQPSRAHEAPQGKVVLTILGHVSKTNAPGRADFDRTDVGRPHSPGPPGHSEQTDGSQK